MGGGEAAACAGQSPAALSALWRGKGRTRRPVDRSAPRHAANRQAPTLAGRARRDAFMAGRYLCPDIGGNNLIGLQIDFDAKTRHLQNYAAFLADLRKRLPQRYELSITGLLDWSANGDPAGLRSIGGSVDELVLQVYQGRRTIPGYQRYLQRLNQLNIPFRIGLVQGGEWAPPASLQSNPNFRGYVVFLVNEKGRD
jgi:hypothetical protein